MEEGAAASLRGATSVAAATSGGRRHGGADPPSASLHAVRKPAAKPWKKPAAPPAPPKVFRVEPRGFRELVQRLTGAPTVAPRRPPPPPPLVIFPRSCPPLPWQACPFGGSSGVLQPSSSPDFAAEVSSGAEAATGVLPPPTAADPACLSRAYMAAIPPTPPPALWCHIPLSSPGSFASTFEQSSVLSSGSESFLPSM